MFKKIQLTATLFTITIGIGLAAKTVIPEAQAIPPNTSGGSPVTFLCQVIDKVPNTITRINSSTLSLGQTRSSLSDISVIQWKRSYYSESNETPMQRCTRVSNLFQYYGSKKALNYITYGDMDGREVVCATTSEGSPCSLLIFILEKDENPKQLVSDLRQIIQSPQILSSSGSNIPDTRVSSIWRNPQTAYYTRKVFGRATRIPYTRIGGAVR
jgi:hypothetical protein